MFYLLTGNNFSIENITRANGSAILLLDSCVDRNGKYWFPFRHRVNSFRRGTPVSHDPLPRTSL